MDIVIESWSFDNNASCELYLRVNCKRFVIILSPDPSPGFDSIDAVEAQYLKRLDAALELDDKTKQWEIFREIQPYLLNISQQWFQELAPVVDGQDLRCTLDILLAPEIFALQLVTLNGEAQVIRRHDVLPPTCDFRPTDMTELSMDLPIFYPNQIEVLEKCRQLRVLKVLVDGQIRCCKLAKFPYPSISRELQVLQAIAKANIDPSIRLPRLKGYVMSQDGVGLIGFLMDYIERHQDIPNLRSLKQDMHAIERCRRQKWADQTVEIIEKLHEAGIVWGDAKAENILIDKDDNAWLIDLGGGWTDGWVDRDMQDTKEGDLQALKLIHDFLKL